MERTQFTFYESFSRAIGRIKKKADRADAYDAICAYALYGTEPNIDKLSDAAAIAFELIKPNLDASRRKANSGKAGGEKKQSASKPEANAKQEQSASKKENKKENKKEKENKCYTPLSPSQGETGFGDRLQDAFESWLRYKQEKRQSYKPEGLQSLITQIRKHADTYGEEAVADLIDECKAANWQGIIFDRLKGKEKSAPPKRKSWADVAAEMEAGL